jgi:hypothetical protein
LARRPLQRDTGTSAASKVRTASLHDFTFDVDAHFALLTFPWFGKGFETISMSSLDPYTWPDEYTLTMAPPKGDETLVTIDRNETVREILWNYARGGHVFA